MYFTLAVSAGTRERCAALVSVAASTDPRVMPIPGPPALVWRACDERSAVLCWPGGTTPPAPPGGARRCTQGIESFQGQRQVGAPLVPRNRVHLVHDDRFHAAQRFPGLRGEQQEE